MFRFNARPSALTAHIRPKLTRNISKIEVSNPWAIFWLRQSRSVLRGILIFYGSALVIGAGGYFGSAWYTDKYQKMAKEWPIGAKIAARVGVFYQDVRDSEENAELGITYALKAIAQEEGLEIESEDNKKFKLLGLKELESKSKLWKARYIDLVERLALLKAELGDVDNSWKLCHYSLNLPMDLGDQVLKSKTLRLAAKLDRLKGKMKESENYLLDAVRLNEYRETGIKFQGHGSHLLDPTSVLTPELFHSLLDLGVTYTLEEEYTKSLEIFLNLLQVLEKDNSALTMQKPLLKNYVGEILYQKGITTKSIEWCRAAFKEAYITSRSDVQSAHVAKQALDNLIKLYRKTGETELEKEAERARDELVIPLKNTPSTFLLEQLFK